MEEKRPSPDELLQRIQEEEQSKSRGKLKIYLGAAPGVGKTHEMLHDALEEHNKGLDVVIGVVESHGRKEIDAQLSDFEILPRQIVDYRDKPMQEFDLDAALKRQPSLMLMDEMAHTNVPGVRHNKRWQDIKELLDRGINVYTTLNVQHIESLNDTVSQIIHANVNETVPDSMINLADTIELVDIPPDVLLKRLHEGKVYLPEQASLATEHFFRKGNLIALRELALRATAERVAQEVLLYRKGEGIKHIWPTKEKILVCVGSRPESMKLIREAKHIANSLQAEWVAVYVETPKLKSREMERNIAIRNLHFAEQLGAEIRILTGFDIIKELMSYAREVNVTQIMVWKNIRTRWQEFFFRSLADEIVRHSEEIDVYIMTGKHSGKVTKENNAPKNSSFSLGYFLSIAVVTVTTGINLFLSNYLRPSNLVMMYLLSIVVIALYGEIGPAILGSMLSVIAYGYFFMPQNDNSGFPDIEYGITLLVMLLVSYIISHFTVLLRRQAATAGLVERQTSALYVLSHRLANTRGMDKLLTVGTEYIAEIFDSHVSVFLPHNRQLTIWKNDPDNYQLNKKEMGIAHWVYELGHMAGLGTENLPFSGALYVPMVASKDAIGVLRITPNVSGRLFTPEQMRLLESCVNQIASALEIDQLQKKEISIDHKNDIDFIRNTLFQSVAHDLHIPLIAILAEASMLTEVGDTLAGEKVKAIGKTIYTEIYYLNSLISNLVQLSYLESDKIKLQKSEYSLKELINFIINTLNKKLHKNAIRYDIPKKMPHILIDKTLIQEVFMNLVDNAIKFSPPEKQNEIFVKIEVEKSWLLISVEDSGPGIMLDESTKLFEKFYRGRMLTSKRGLGLGLVICKKIIEAHGGKIWAENRESGGAAFRFTLPIEEQDDK